MTDWPNDTFLSARNIVRACEASLRRLQTDWIDLYQFHHVDLRTPWEEIWQACETLVAQGKVLYVGSSNHAGWQIAAANEAAAPPATSRAWSASSRTTTCSPAHVELEVLPAAQHYGVGIIPWSPLAGGLLGRRAGEDRGRTAQRRAHRRSGSRSTGRRWSVRGVLPRARATRRPTSALAWLLHQPAVTAPIIGPRTMEQFEGALRALDVALDDDALGPARRDLPRLQGRPPWSTPGEPSARRRQAGDRLVGRASGRGGSPAAAPRSPATPGPR